MAPALAIDPASDGVGATLVVALLPADAVRNPGDHKGRPYSRSAVFEPARKRYHDLPGSLKEMAR